MPTTDPIPTAEDLDRLEAYPAHPQAVTLLLGWCRNLLAERESLAQQDAAAALRVNIDTCDTHPDATWATYPTLRGEH